jgi:hypothetical protein
VHPKLPPQVGTWLLAAARGGRWQQGQTDRRSLRDRAQPTYPVSQIRRWLRAGGAGRIREENARLHRRDAMKQEGVHEFRRADDAGPQTQNRETR